MSKKRDASYLNILKVPPPTPAPQGLWQILCLKTVFLPHVHF